MFGIGTSVDHSLHRQTNAWIYSIIFNKSKVTMARKLLQATESILLKVQQKFRCCPPFLGTILTVGKIFCLKNWFPIRAVQYGNAVVMPGGV